MGIGLEIAFSDPRFVLHSTTFPFFSPSYPPIIAHTQLSLAQESDPPSRRVSCGFMDFHIGQAATEVRLCPSTPSKIPSGKRFSGPPVTHNIVHICGKPKNTLNSIGYRA